MMNGKKEFWSWPQIVFFKSWLQYQDLLTLVQFVIQIIMNKSLTINQKMRTVLQRANESSRSLHINCRLTGPIALRHVLSSPADKEYDIMWKVTRHRIAEKVLRNCTCPVEILTRERGLRNLQQGHGQAYICTHYHFDQVQIALKQKSRGLHEMQQGVSDKAINPGSATAMPPVDSHCLTL
jgi:hypothetical protein